MRIMPPGLMEAINRGAPMRTHSTLELFIVNGGETRTYYFATASLKFNGVVWQPHMRKGDEISSSLLGESDSATIELQNVDTILGNEFADLERSLDGAGVNVGRYWLDLERGDEWHKVFLTGRVEDVRDDEQAVRLTIMSDVYSAGASVGHLREIRGLCQAPGYKRPECGSTSNLSTCARRLADCLERHPGDDGFARHMGAPFRDLKLPIAIPS